MTKIKLSHCIIALIVALAFVLGHTMGTTQTIRQAELLDITDTEYQLGFGVQIHTYTKE